jgi:pyruvate formate lyase activating enzyme
MLPIIGFQGTSLIDFPGRIASIIFFGGCDLRCPYCHNESLFTFDKTQIIPVEKLMKTLHKRKNFIDGVVVTGGEPTLYPELTGLLQKIKSELGLEVKLDSHGLHPEVIEKLLPFISRVCIDIKTTPDLYSSLGSKVPQGEVEKRLLQTKSLLENFSGEVEYRTTMYPPVVESYDRLYKMMDFVSENAEYYIQRFMPENAWSDEAKNTKSYLPEQLERMALELRKNLGRETIYLRTYS